MRVYYLKNAYKSIKDYVQFYPAISKNDEEIKKPHCIQLSMGNLQDLYIKLI